jgi:hypothetical protein
VSELKQHEPKPAINQTSLCSFAWAFVDTEIQVEALVSPTKGNKNA